MWNVGGEGDAVYSVIYGNGNIRQQKNFDSVNGNEKLRKMETKRKRKNLKRKLINLAISIFVSVIFPFQAITQVLCNVIR